MYVYALDPCGAFSSEEEETQHRAGADIFHAQESP